MQKSLFFGDQNVLPGDLNAIADAYSFEIKRSRQSFLGTSGGRSLTGIYDNPIVGGGIVGSAAESSLNKNLKVYLTSSVITIFPGFVIDVNGEIIYVYDSENGGTTTINRGQAGTYSAWVDGLTGDYYVKLKYVALQSSQRADLLGDLHYTRETGSYFISIDTDVPDSDEIVLAIFTATAGVPNLSTFIDTRQYLSVNTLASAVTLNVDNLPYAGAYTVEDHVYAFGTGTPSATNPHGLTLADIGYIDELDVEEHRTYEHMNGIMALKYTAASRNAYKPSVAGSYIVFEPADTAYMIIHGIKVDGDISPVDWSTIYTAQGDGSYYIRINEEGVLSYLRTSSYDSTLFRDPEAQDLYLILGTITISGSGVYASIGVDIRKFFVTSQSEIRYDSAEATSNPLSAPYPYYSVVDNLNRIRYQLSMALLGTSANWKTNIPTMFSDTNVDNCHKHSFDNLDDAFALGVTIADIFGLVDGSTSSAHNHAYTTTDLFEVAHGNVSLYTPTGFIYPNGDGTYGGLVQHEVAAEGHSSIRHMFFYSQIDMVNIDVESGSYPRGTLGAFVGNSFYARGSGSGSPGYFMIDNNNAILYYDDIYYMTQGRDASEIHNHDSIYANKNKMVRFILYNDADFTIADSTNVAIPWSVDGSSYDACKDDFFDNDDLFNGSDEFQYDIDTNVVFKVPESGVYRITGYFNLTNTGAMSSDNYYEVTLYSLTKSGEVYTANIIQKCSTYYWNIDAIRTRLSFNWVGEMTFSADIRYYFRIHHENFTAGTKSLLHTDAGAGECPTYFVIEKIK